MNIRELNNLLNKYDGVIDSSKPVIVDVLSEDGEVHIGALKMFGICKPLGQLRLTAVQERKPEKG